ncbi:ABC transporter substrate-binding protein [Plastoroseomonas hellenica]|uniref:ABC transporter substrate-binding protein n=1 Tax=Plastoroseomonas hellenica TaxID=2687306 RepID=UPI001BA70B6F|nr:ABC transporter substrate-binding protein [Plastoroseomonas hellenica]MBR0642578.1 ABC transporter substrate-binding protein [Plastoroseomonas hellenica]
MLQASKRSLLLSAAMLPIAARAPGAAEADATLQMAVGAVPTSLDPHYHTLTPNNALAQHFFDNLVHRDAQARLVPALAESWRLIDETTWEFRLRQGVTFHNGEPFTARDVLYTLDRVPQVVNSPGSFGVFTRAIKSAEAIDPHTLHFRTDSIYPLLPADLSQVSIIWHGVADYSQTGDFNTGRAAIGTGPFRLTAYRHGERAEMERNPGYWGEAPAWSRVSYRFIPNDGARVAALRAGDIAFIDAVPTADLARVRSEPRFVISETVSLRSVYLRPDFRERTAYVAGPNGEPLSVNPLRDLRVRQALSTAINRAAIAERIMAGAAIPTGQFMPPGTYGHVPDLPAPAFDPDGARRLLAEAGYPQGFTITLHGPNDRYVNDAQIAQSIGQMWARIGVKARIDTMPYAAYAQRNARSDTSIPFGGWANSSGEPSAGLRGLLGTRDVARGWGTVNRSGYSSQAYDATLTRALATADDEDREKLFQEATRIAARDVAWIPLHVQKNIWAMRRGLAHAARADEMTLAQDVRPA